MRKDITDNFLRALKPPATGRIEINDTACRNLQLRLTSTGVATWSLRYTVGNKVKRMNLGHYPMLTLKQARSRANEQRGKIDAGEDPAETAKETKKAKADIERQSFAYLAGRYLNEHSRRHNRASSYEENRRNLGKHVLPFWGDLPFASIKRPVVIERLEEIIGAGHHSAANRIHALVSKIFSFAIEVGLLEAHPIAGLKKRGKERTKDRVLSDDELRLFWDRIVESPVSQSTGLALRLALLTGMRSSEVAGLRKDELHDLGDRTAAALVLPPERVKTKQTLALPLPSLLLDTVNEALSLVPDGSEFVFPSAVEGTCIEGHSLGTAMRRFGDALTDGDGPGAKSWRKAYPTPHDLRRTLCTRLGMLGCADSLIERIANHTPQSVNRKHYNMHRYDAEKRQALEAWARELQAIVSGKKAASNVVQMGRAG
jgi:integrase